MHKVHSLGVMLHHEVAQHNQEAEVRQFLNFASNTKIWQLN
jgi:hypothetical protein